MCVQNEEIDVNTEKTSDELNIQITSMKLEPGKKYVIKITTPTQWSKESISKYCERLGECLKNIGITQYVILPEYDEIKVELENKN